MDSKSILFTTPITDPLGSNNGCHILPLKYKIVPYKIVPHSA